MIQGLEAPYCSGCRQLLFEGSCCRDCRPAPMIVFSLGHFENQLQTILHDLKYRKLRPLAGTLGRKLAELISPHMDDFGFDLIIPVPLHDSRRYQRGFNQSEEIALALGRWLNLPVATEILYAARKTRQQARLPAHRREANVRGAYGVNDENRLMVGKTVLIVDDVTTTGATLRENARVLRAASVRKIAAAVTATAT
jgi:competence protein ComFC